MAVLVRIGNSVLSDRGFGIDRNDRMREMIWINVCGIKGGTTPSIRRYRWKFFQMMSRTGRIDNTKYIYGLTDGEFKELVAVRCSDG